MFEETYASVTTNVAGREIKLETGKIARQATASIIASSGDNQVLVLSLIHISEPTRPR